MTSTSSSSLAQLVSLGIPKVKAVYALKEFDNNAEVAADWCFTEGSSWTPNDLLQTTLTPPSTESSDSSSPLNSSLSSQPRSIDRHTPSGWTQVPARLLVSGTPVAITLKQDQGTDRTVQGLVNEKLTRGDHPRGVKVRLRDGRVGRVVRILSGLEAETVGRTG
ncbi:hypothetical protein JCM5353_000462 [Sporobolomyces roseus]